MSQGSNTTRDIASILAAVPASVWDRARATADRLAAADREWRRSQPPAAPAENPWGIRGVPTRESLLRIVEPWRAKFLTGGHANRREMPRDRRGLPKASTAVHRVRKMLLAVRRSTRLHATEAIPHDALEVLNREIGGYGVRSIELRTGEAVTYVDLGDTYATTLLLIRRPPTANDRGARWQFKVGSWGDLVERAG